MAETAAYLVDNIIPSVRIRQYVLSVPIPLRYWMARGKKLLAKVHKIFASEVESFYTRKNKKAARSGSVCCVGRFGGALNLNVHFHLLQIEGVYELKKTATAKFKKRKAPSGHDIKNLVMIIREKIIKLLRRSGYPKDPSSDEDEKDPLFEKEPSYAGLMSASVRQRILLGERQGQRVRFIGSSFAYGGDSSKLRSKLCAMVGSFSSLIEKLSALIPQPRMHLVRYRIS